MRLILATSNQDKVREIKEIYSSLCEELNLEILSYDTLITPFEIVENGESFKENALIKSKAVFDTLKQQGILRQEDIILSDDSGICVDALDGKPGIHSARYSGGNARDNLNLLSLEVSKLPNQTSNAHYCACIGISSAQGHFSAHGFMYGSVISTPRGSNGFGYDPMFIPQGFNKTLAELSSKEKNTISHRRHALVLASYILRALRA
ncbi:non-canonical purine NTP pyrophosphatase [Helicobacter turcicus]|uniref:dITP/XTP pyrophosphatase n=1 Tax=Helicobacter turcicus TaxID=2867412 RepID=A0ABS7JNT3_9HELI|nr:non-canonical purine NTP pyrophosphatase [Helicobacter turcicus]MBX7491058.1 non-canonical purine NTP pyrophosphatase [Helicobacter turcicus]MBX7546319.1 non-canonical purine NTP pyrophosphatase [Helicobacter turcicus]